MSSWLIPVIVTVAVADVIVMWWIFTKRRVEALGGMTFMEFQRFSRMANGMIRDHMKVNYGGEASQLPAVLPGLLSRLSSHALSTGLMIERPKLKLVTGRLIAMQKIATPDEIDAAMKQVA